MNRRLRTAIAALGLLVTITLAGCDALSTEPNYGGLSIAGFNYTPYNLVRFVITDRYGNRASGGGDLPPGSGEGRLSCCYKLKGTEFTVKWEVYDADEAILSLRAKQPIKVTQKSAAVRMPPTKISGDLGSLVLGLHFYPDDHIEFEFRTDLRGTRIFYGAIDEWLLKKQGKSFNDTMEDWVAFRRTARIAGEGWTKYRFTNTEDLKQYVYYTLLVNPNFDQHPAVRQIIEETNGQPGAFGEAMDNIAPKILEELKGDQFKPSPAGDFDD
ncbi:DUF3304 domain-containing protein [Cupriavidus pauculus]|uniref:DUF3304 domain-containing protein n=1 Tax=Cupriavidus pauculus TaxID=82633 RepID=A0A3G8H560_9BURK|nr:DUF3304 domain-containing protein [Cupriavidus pauculus]AZG15647.1 DUF3304 domain-containing protein [Cupriavidus pauculus]